MYLEKLAGSLERRSQFIYNILADVGKASNMIQNIPHGWNSTTPEERFTQAVLQDNRY